MRYAGLLVEAPSGRVLLVRRSRHQHRAGTWEAPGGHVEPGERPIDAALREFTEETGYSGDIARLVVLDDRTAYTLYHGLVPREFRPTLSWEHDAYSWSDPARPPPRTHPMLVWALG